MTVARAVASPAARLRCAIYTRKSTEEGLDQDFNSLDAQREAAEAFIASQKSEGWTAAPDRYDDGGFSGGNMERPALARLLADIEAGKVDIVLVYKVDRLSRSLLDFARMMELFERKKISFVSVTQQFNTASSLGRLVLNILLSFAQFEREMISERTRDKMGAARRKGKWVGGRPPLGYDVVAGRLRTNEDEAAQVRDLFALYLEERLLLRVAEIANARGWRMKTWVTKNGHRKEGNLWSKSGVARLLTNVAYVGQVAYGGGIFVGEHSPIVDRATFDRAGALLGGARRERAESIRNRYGFLLRGLVRCTACGSAMTSTVTSTRGKPYRYYTCTAVHRSGTSRCPVRSVQAEALESFVVDRVRSIGSDPALIRAVYLEARQQHEHDLPSLRSEERRLRAEAERARTEAAQLLAELATTKDGDGRFTRGRLGELDARATAIDRRLAEIARETSEIEANAVSEEEVGRVLREFSPVWEVLAPRERARILQLLIDRIEYDGVGGELKLRLRPAGLKLLSSDTARNAEEAHP